MKINYKYYINKTKHAVSYYKNRQITQLGNGRLSDQNRIAADSRVSNGIEIGRNTCK